VLVVVTLAELDTTVPSGFVSSAVIVVLPTLMPFASPPGEVTVAMVGMLEIHTVWGELVTSTSRPDVPEVARAMNCPV
jgi:hypothetical protein